MDTATLKKQKTLFTIVCLITGFQQAGTEYVSAYLKTIGLSVSVVGFFTSLRSVVGIIAPIMWGVICDKLQTNKRPYIICIVATMILFPLIPLSETALRLISITPWLTIIVRFFYRPAEYILSSWMTQLQNDNKDFDYGKIKSFSTIGSTLGSLICTALLSYYSLRASFYMVSVFSALAMLLIPFLKDAKPNINKDHRSFKDIHLLKAISDPELLAFYIFAISLSVGSCARSNFLLYLLEEINLPSTYISLSMFVVLVCALPLSFISNKIFNKIPILLILIICAISSIVSTLLLSVCHSATTLILACVVTGIFSSIKTIGCIYYSYRIAPKELKNTVVMMNSTMVAFATISASVLASEFIDKYDVFTFYRATAVVITIVTILYIIYKKYISEYISMKHNEK